MGAAIPEPQSQSHAIDGEAFKYVADKMVCEAGIEAMLHRMCVAVMEGNTIKGVITESKAGEKLFRRHGVDASGDADICFRSGAPTKNPIEEMIGVSVMFSMSGVDKQKFIANVKEDPQTYSDWNSVGWQIKLLERKTNYSLHIKKPLIKQRKLELFQKA